MNVVHELWPAAPHQLAALSDCLVLQPNYCNALQLLHYNTTLNAFGKSEFHLVDYSYSITRAQQAKLKCMLVVPRPQWRRVEGAGSICPRSLAQRGAERGAR